MRITRIQLHNIGPFCGDHTLDLSAPPSLARSMNLVGGRNGSGKTTILEALYLLWYGSRSPYVKQNKEGWAAYRLHLIHKWGEGPASVAVELEAALGRDQTCFRVEATWDKQTASRGPHYVVSNEGREDELLSQRWLVVAEELLPLALAPLFWSDGEHVAATLEAQAVDTSFAKAVRSILGLDLTTPLLKTLQQIMSKAAEDAEDLSPARGLVEYEREITSLETRRRIIKQDLAAARSRLRYLHREHPGDQDILENQESTSTASRVDLKELARGPLALLPLVPALEHASQWLQALADNPGHKQIGAELLLDGRDLRLVHTFLRSYAQELTVRATAGLDQRPVSQSEAHLPEDLTCATETAGNRALAEERLATRLESELGSVDEQLRRMQQARKRVLDQTRRSRRSGGIGVRKLEIAVRVKDLMEDFAGQVSRRRLQSLEQNLNAALRLLARKGQSLGRLRAEAEVGQILLINEDGEPVPIHHLSSGEQQLLMLAMMQGLRASSGLQVPLIMDTLLARLDLEHRERLLSSLRETTGSQIILFATDGEIGAHQVDSVAPAVLHLLDHSLPTKETQIHRGRYFGPEEEPHCFQTRSS